MKKEYSNGEITVVWKPELCIHSAICLQGLPDVFQPREKPWIKIEAATTDDIRNQVKACPSGALSYYMNIESENLSNQNKTEEMAKIEIIPNGPIKVIGDCEVALPGGSTDSKAGAVFLCRCGQSSNKPYCDGSHKKDFKVD